jgi:DNA-binding NarL/FixJ family response regulator
MVRAKVFSSLSGSINQRIAEAGSRAGSFSPFQRKPDTPHAPQGICNISMLDVLAGIPAPSVPNITGKELMSRDSQKMPSPAPAVIANSINTGHGAAEPLSRRQTQVAELVSLGLTNKEIGSKLGLQEATIGTYLKGIYHRLRIHSRARLAALWSSRRLPLQEDV